MKLVNTFNWSHSAAGDFDQCPRRRYWAKYEAWEGWDRHAAPRKKAAYRLNKMDWLATILGKAVEMGVVDLLARHRAGRALDVEACYLDTVAPYLNTCWQQSKKKLWNNDAKRNCCLFEHYYQTPTPEQEKTWTQGMKMRAHECLQHFVDDILPLIAEVSAEQEISIRTPDAGGDCEHFMLRELPGFVLQQPLKIYAIPDFAYRLGDELHIRDWKSGGMHEGYADQLRIYGLWACEVHGMDPANVFLHIDYLKTGESHPVAYSETDRLRTLEHIVASVSGMAGYLEDENLVRNEAVPCEEWDLAADPDVCSRCKFYELCKDELQQL